MEIQKQKLWASIWLRIVLSIFPYEYLVFFLWMNTFFPFYSCFFLLIFLHFIRSSINSNHWPHHSFTNIFNSYIWDEISKYTHRGEYDAHAIFFVRLEISQIEKIDWLNIIIGNNHEGDWNMGQMWFFFFQIENCNSNKKKQYETKYDEQISY